MHCQCSQLHYDTIVLKIFDIHISNSENYILPSNQLLHTLYV
jgi:hypothetical protein